MHISELFAVFPITRSFLETQISHSLEFCLPRQFPSVCPMRHQHHALISGRTKTKICIIISLRSQDQESYSILHKLVSARLWRDRVIGIF